jgi:hypothetical protein
LPCQGEEDHLAQHQDDRGAGAEQAEGGDLPPQLREAEARQREEEAEGPARRDREGSGVQEGLAVTNDSHQAGRGAEEEEAVGADRAAEGIDQD